MNQYIQQVLEELCVEPKVYKMWSTKDKMEVLKLAELRRLSSLLNKLIERSEAK